MLATPSRPQAQGLRAVITTLAKLMTSQHRIYVAASGGSAMGLLKVGYKKLFITVSLPVAAARRAGPSGPRPSRATLALPQDRFARMHELEPLCVLDFYVHESLQRRGVGKAMFEAMLKARAGLGCRSPGRAR